MSLERNIVPRLKQTERRTFFRPDGDIAQSTQMELGFRGGYTVRGEFTEIDWGKRYHPARSFTSHPDLMERMFQVGPAAFDEGSKDAIPEDIVNFDFMHNRHWDKPAEKFVHVIGYDTENGLITIYDKEPVELISDFYRECKPGIIYDGSSNSLTPSDAFHQFDREIFESPLYQQVPALQTSIRELGLSATNTSLTLPSPQEYVRRMDNLREVDKDSGLYYPQVQLYPGTEIPKEVYLAALADGVFPVAANDFSWFTSDAFTERFLATHAYGEPFADALSWYAKGVQTLEPEQQARATSSINTFNDALGSLSLVDHQKLHYTQYLYLGFDHIVRKVGSIEDLKIVQWMHTRGMLGEHQWITDELIVDGFAAHARERLKV